MLWTVARFPNGEWTTGGKPKDPDYANCEVFVVDADTREKAKKKAQAKRTRQRRADGLIPPKSYTNQQGAGGSMTEELKIDWQPIDTAPRDGTPIQADIPGNGKDNIIAWMDGFMDAAEQDCCAWVFVGDQEPPDCWTDGVCWASNENEEKSVEPIAWKPISS